MDITAVEDGNDFVMLLGFREYTNPSVEYKEPNV